MFAFLIGLDNPIIQDQMTLLVPLFKPKLEL